MLHVRGCEIEGMLDEDGRVIEEGPDPRPELTGNKRTYRVWIDANQYRRDMTAHENGEEVCQTCNRVYATTIHDGYIQ